MQKGNFHPDRQTVLSSLPFLGRRDLVCAASPANLGQTRNLEAASGNAMRAMPCEAVGFSGLSRAASSGEERTTPALPLPEGSCLLAIDDSTPHRRGQAVCCQATACCAIASITRQELTRLLSWGWAENSREQLGPQGGRTGVCLMVRPSRDESKGEPGDRETWEWHRDTHIIKAKI